VQLKRGAWVVHFPHAGPWGPDWSIIRSLFRFGLPAGMQGIAMNIGGVLLLGFIGSLALSAEAQAAYAVAYTEIFSLITWTSVGLMGAIATVTGQNLGAGQADRAEAAVHLGGRIAGFGALAIGLTFVIAPRLLLGAFGMAEPVVLTLGAQLLRVLSVSGVFIAVALAYTGGLQGSGDTKGPLYISLVSQLALPLSICFVVQQTIGLEPLWIWLAILSGHVTRCSLSVWRFRQGHWRHIRV
jgi:Na+-driven multidrug efflux pump